MRNRTITKVAPAVLLLLTLIGCTQPNLNTQKSEKELNLIADPEVSQNLSGYEVVEYERSFSVKNETVSSILKKLSDKYKIVYMLDSGDLTLKDSIYKVSNLSDLENYIYETTNYKLVSDEPTYGKNKIFKVKLVKKHRNEKEYIVQGSTSLYKALGVLIKDNVNIVFNEGVKDTPIALSVRSDNIGDYIDKVCTTANVWCEYDGKNVKVDDKKTFYITSPIRGKINFSMGGAQGSGGASQSTTDGDGSAMASKASQSVSYSIENIDFKELVGQLQEQFQIDMYPSANGFFMFNGTPKQHKLITAFFNEYQSKQELIYVRLQLLRVDLKNQFQYGVDWTKFGKLSIGGYALVGSGTFGNTLTEGAKVGVTGSNADGAITALNTFGNVHMVDNFYNQTLTGKLIPFSNYKLIRYFTTGTSQSETSTETTIEIKEDEVGFKGNMVVTKSDNGYYIDGIIELSTVFDFITLQLDEGEIKAPEIVGKTVRVSTKMNKLGNTIIIGGFRSKGMDNTEKSVPLLGEIPAIEWLFSGKDNQSLNSEFIVLLTLESAKTGRIRQKRNQVELGRNYTDKKIPYSDKVSF